MAVIDLRSEGRFPEIKTLPLLQRLSVDEVGLRDHLPSFLYWPTDAQREQLSDFAFEAEGWVMGHGAVDMGRRVKGRLVSSAKSWLCHSRVNRNAELLPWGAEEGVRKISPVSATELILKHLVFAWEQSEFGESPIGEQCVTVTLPASFDQTARALTVEACQKAGLGHAKLLEEPQAAFYNWISLRKGRWSEALKGCERVCVCDIGGGTSDFSLIRCHEQDDKMNFEREAVGQHLLLGGDNIDLALAHQAESKLSKGKRQLNLSQWQQLSQLARAAKEKLLGSGEESVELRLPGSGRKVIGGLRKTTLEREATADTVLSGFFPLIDDNYQAKNKEGLQEMGLPYEAEPAITWHLKDFLQRHGALSQTQGILFNGGTLEPEAVRQRMLDMMAKLCDGKTPVLLESDSLAEAVARGAAYYGFSTERGGLRVGGGSPHAYYLTLTAADGPKQVCVIPKGTEPHEPALLKLEGLEVKANHPVSFQLSYGDEHPLDEVGSVHLLSEGSPSLELQAMVRFGKQGQRQVPVQIRGELTELDTLMMELVSVHTDHRWKLEFDLRQQQQEADDTAPQAMEGEAFMDIPDNLEALIVEAFSGKQPKSLLKVLETQVDKKRNQWDVPFLRSLVDTLLKHPELSKKSAQHEANWLMACGYGLRPGYGDPGDEIRRQKVWSFCRSGAHFSRDVSSRSQWATLWRRLAPGLEDGRQSDLIQRQKRDLIDKKGAPLLKGAGVEWWRMLCAMETMPVVDKLKLGRSLVQSLLNDESLLEMKLWCLGRLGTRQPLGAGPEFVIPATEVEPWVKMLLEQEQWSSAARLQAIVECSRKCGERSLDVCDELRAEVLEVLKQIGEGSESHSFELVQRGGQRNLSEQSQVLGEALPAGLHLR
jgi:hypothetical protein